MRTARICRIGTILPFAILAACQPQLNSDLPSAQAAYNVIPPMSDTTGEVYHLQAGDVVSITVFREPDLSVLETPIDNMGNLFLPLIGQIRAAGRTQADLSAEIEQAYGQTYLREPRVAVIVNETMSNTVAVEGEVIQPGVYPLPPGATLLSALAQARSPSLSAKLDEVLVFRNVNGQRMGARFDVVAIRAGRAPDPQILGGDVIVVGFSRVRGGYQDFLRAAPILNVFTQF